MENQLFPDSQIFTNERPLEMTEKQSKEFYLELANEVIKEKWHYNDVDKIAEDLSELSDYDNGFQKGKDLDDKYGYEIDTTFVEWLDCIEDRKNEVIDENVRAWVKAHDIKAKFMKHDALIVQNSISNLYKKDDVIYVTNIYPDVAKYTVDINHERKGGYIFPFEKIESNCKPRPY